VTDTLSTILPALYDALGPRSDRQDARNLIDALAADPDAWDALRRAVEIRREVLDLAGGWAPGMEDVDE
jgi:hypothetical protein